MKIIQGGANLKHEELYSHIIFVKLRPLLHKKQMPISQNEFEKKYCLYESGAQNGRVVKTVLRNSVRQSLVRKLFSWKI